MTTCEKPMTPEALVLGGRGGGVLIWKMCQIHFQPKRAWKSTNGEGEGLLLALNESTWEDDLCF